MFFRIKQKYYQDQQYQDGQDYGYGAVVEEPQAQYEQPMETVRSSIELVDPLQFEQPLAEVSEAYMEPDPQPAVVAPAPVAARVKRAQVARPMIVDIVAPWDVKPATISKVSTSRAATTPVRVESAKPKQSLPQPIMMMPFTAQQTST